MFKFLKRLRSKKEDSTKAQDEVTTEVAAPATPEAVVAAPDLTNDPEPQHLGIDAEPEIPAEPHTTPKNKPKPVKEEQPEAPHVPVEKEEPIEEVELPKRSLGDG
ncbi:MAG: hypothetical protein VW942_05295, partial [Aquiluna sp.]